MPNGLPANRATLQSQREITIANDLIGCIIGRGGQKISEIRFDWNSIFDRLEMKFFCFRQASGANIKIADLDEGSQDRHVTISGTPEQIQLAEFLIHSRYYTNNLFLFQLIKFSLSLSPLYRIASEIGGILITHWTFCFSSFLLNHITVFCRFFSMQSSGS